MSDKNDPLISKYPSMNRETGVIENIDDLRAAAQAYLELIYIVLRLPLIGIFLPDSIMFDLAAAAVSLESMTHQMSQAGMLRKTASFIGRETAAEEQIANYGLSETLPNSHPDAPDVEEIERRRQLEAMATNPYAQTSYFADAMGEWAKSGGGMDVPIPSHEQAQEPTQPPPPLPEGIESFLRNLGQRRETDDTHNDGADAGTDKES